MHSTNFLARAWRWGAALALAAVATAATASAATSTDPIYPPALVQLRADPATICPETTMVYMVVSHPADSCLRVTGVVRDSITEVRLVRDMPYGQPCNQHNRDERLPLGRFRSGDHVVPVRVRVFVWQSADSGYTSSDIMRFVSFHVDSACGSPPPPPPPPPPPSPRSYVTGVQIGQPSPCLSCPPVTCPDQPVLVKMQATLPSACQEYLGMSIMPVAGMPDRDVIQVRFRARCPDSLGVCAPVVTLVRDSMFLPAQAPGLHRLELRAVELVCADSVRNFAARVYEYTVLDSCGPPPPPPPSENCALPFLVPTLPITADARPCELELRRGGVGSFFYSAQSQGVRLAGLQGIVSAPTDRLHIERLEAAGFALGMHLQTQRQEDGSMSFVLWSDRGAPIPAGVPMPVLRVFVRADSLAAPGIVYVSGVVTAASDSAGRNVPLCDIQTFAPVVARVCIGAAATGCNVNGDSLTNVADLVRMVRCWYRPQDCPDTLAARPDCNGDGAFHLDDVLCCARSILGGRRDSTGHAPGNLRFAFGQPSLMNDVLRVPLTMSGGGQLSGALLRLNFPFDRYEAGEWDAAGQRISGNGAIGETSWTVLTEPGSEDILLGLLRLDDAASENVTMTLQLRLRPGQQHGGSIGILEGELTAADGGFIEVPLAGVTAQLPQNPAASESRIELAGARPNPTAGRTTFAVSLPAGGSVDLAMYDLAGRRVATLWRGTMEAGTREFAWEPGSIRSGVYFARLVVDGEVRTSRVVLRQTR